MTVYYSIDIEDHTKLEYDLEPYATAKLFKDSAGVVRIHQCVVVEVPDEDAGLIRFLLESVHGYEIVDTNTEIIYV